MLQLLFDSTEPREARKVAMHQVRPWLLADCSGPRASAEQEHSSHFIMMILGWMHKGTGRRPQLPFCRASHPAVS